MSRMYFLCAAIVCGCAHASPAESAIVADEPYEISGDDGELEAFNRMRIRSGLDPLPPRDSVDYCQLASLLERCYLLIPADDDYFAEWKEMVDACADVAVARSTRTTGTIPPLCREPPEVPAE